MSLPFVSEANLAIDKREDGVILAHTHILAWQDISTALAHEDRASVGEGSGSDLDS